MQNEHDTKGELCSIYDINYAGVEDKFVNSILHENQFKLSENNDQVVTEIYYAWRCQSDLNFVFFAPNGEQLLPDTDVTNKVMDTSPFTIHEIVRSTSKPNFVQGRFPFDSQLNVEAWKKHLQGY